MFLILFNLISILYLTNGQSINHCPNYGPFCTCESSNVIMSCSGFDSFSKLDFNKGLVNNTFYELELNPVDKLMLDTTLNLDGIIVTNNIKLYGLKGFVFDKNPFKALGVKNSLSLFLFETNFDFYIEKNSILVPLDPNECKSTNGALTDTKVSPVFSSFASIAFSTGILYPNEICPYVFKDAKLKFLTFELIDQFPTKIKLNFIDVNADINSNIDRLNLYNFNVTYLNSAILNKNVFVNLKSLIIDYCILDDIQENLFISFKMLRYIRLQLSNFDSFMYSSSNKAWMKYLNGDIKVNLKNQTEIDLNKKNQMLIEFANRYEDDSEYVYLDEEIFKFQYFPHDKLVFPKIFSKDNLDCSLTLRYLLKYWRNYNDVEDINTIAVQNCLLLISPNPTTIAPQISKLTSTIKNSST